MNKLFRNRKRKGFTLIELMIVVAIIGILAAVAIPAFLRYIKKSKTTESVQNLRRLYDSSVAYYESDWAEADGDIVPSQFPATAAVTPVLANIGSDKLRPVVDDWTLATWVALNFALSDPHYYAYQYDSSGSGMDSNFTATAFGDLDADGVYSTFVRVGTIDEQNEIRGGAGIFRANELE